jgi:hypothetical protein
MLKEQDLIANGGVGCPEAFPLGRKKLLAGAHTHRPEKNRCKVLYQTRKVLDQRFHQVDVLGQDQYEPLPYVPQTCSAEHHVNTSAIGMGLKGTHCIYLQFFPP